jgi:hypothetical protein
MEGTQEGALLIDGRIEGRELADGRTEGSSDGNKLGLSDGNTLGSSDGRTEGSADGNTLGDEETLGETLGDGDTLGGSAKILVAPTPLNAKMYTAGDPSVAALHTPSPVGGYPYDASSAPTEARAASALVLFEVAP